MRCFRASVMSFKPLSQNCLWDNSIQCSAIVSSQTKDPLRNRIQLLVSMKIYQKNGRIHHFHRNSYSKILSYFNHIQKEYRLHGVSTKCLVVETLKQNQFHDCLDVVEEREARPPLHHFEFSDLKKEKQWESLNLKTCFQDYKTDVQYRSVPPQSIVKCGTVGVNVYFQ